MALPLNQQENAYHIQTKQWKISQKLTGGIKHGSNAHTILQGEVCQEHNNLHEC
jgi:hypothetical protein